MPGMRWHEVGGMAPGGAANLGAESPSIPAAVTVVSGTRNDRVSRSAMSSGFPDSFGRSPLSVSARILRDRALRSRYLRSLWDRTVHR